MSRTRKAALIAGFSYVQFGLALVSGIVLVPFILREIGTERYGLWLACGELLAYSAMVDLGVLGVLPWMIAQKNGEGDRRRMRELIGNGLFVAALTGAAYLLIAYTLWRSAASAMSLDAAQRGTLWGPLLIVAVGTASLFPLRAFGAALQAMQDVVFIGLLSIGQWVLNICLLVVMLKGGYGLHSLAAAAVVPPLAVSVCYFLRLCRIAPDLIAVPRAPSRSDFLLLLKDGFGVWLGGLGWRMVAASSSLIIVAVAGAEAAVVYACTAKAGDILMQMSWQLSDSGLVGLAQLSGEGRRERVREVVLIMMRLLAVASGGVAYFVLGFNAVFVQLWVGGDKFGGHTLNALLAANVVLLSVTHGLFVTASVVGNRFRIGVATLLQGVFNVALAVVLGKAFGLPGVAASCSISALLLGLPLGARYLRGVTGLTPSNLWRGVFASWSVRVATMLVFSAAVGYRLSGGAVWPLFLVAPAMGFVYLWHMRPLYPGLPLPSKIHPLLVRMRLIPQQ